MISPLTFRSMSSELQRMQKTASIFTGAKRKIRESAGDAVEEAVGRAAQQAKSQVMSPSGAPRPEIRNFGQAMGADVADAALDRIKQRLTPLKKTMMGAGAGALALGGGMMLASRARRKRQKQDMQDAFAAALQQHQQSQQPAG